MNQIKSLASQTAIYGISSIVGRLINYLLVPLHTSLFSPEEYGQVSYFYAATALLLILYTHGMETTFFRFSTKDSKKSYYNYSFTSVLLVSAVISVFLIVGSDGIATLADYPEDGRLVRWLALIIFLDATTAIPFARLRLENKAKMFAITKMANILINILLQLLFLVAFPSILENEGHALHEIILKIYNPDIGVGYIFLANLLANITLIPMLWPYFKNIRLNLNLVVFRSMMTYSIPLLLTGVAGWITQLLDRLLIGDLLSKGDLGVYDQTFKLAILIQLAVQAFRYAGEPFFFSKASDKNAPELFADILYYFVVFAMIIFVGISFNIDWIAEIMLRRPEYRTVLYLVPIIMMGKLFFGIYVNISIWFKLQDKTIFGTYFTLLGALITILGNIILIPMLGLLGSAITVFLVYFSMTVACYIVGAKNFKVPYKIKPVLGYILSGSLLVWLSFQIKLEHPWMDIALNIIATLLYLITIWLLEKRNLSSKSY
jgi:O-antigen/teichoic acid export membrane protein